MLSFPSLLLIGIATYTSAAPAPAFKRQLASDTASCQALFDLCYYDLKNRPYGAGPFGQNAFNELSCLAVASCYTCSSSTLFPLLILYPALQDLKLTIAATANDDFLRDLSLHEGGNETAQSLTAYQPDLKAWSLISLGQDKLSSQMWIDNLYHQLTRTEGPYPSSSAVVVQFYNRMATW